MQCIEKNALQDSLKAQSFAFDSSNNSIVNVWPKNLERALTFPFSYENYFRVNYGLIHQVEPLGFKIKLFEETLIEHYKIPIVLENQNKKLV